MTNIIMQMSANKPLFSSSSASSPSSAAGTTAVDSAADCEVPGTSSKRSASYSFTHKHTHTHTHTLHLYENQKKTDKIFDNPTQQWSRFVYHTEFNEQKM